MIGDDVEIAILGVRGDKVRIGVVAPDSVAIYRREVYLRIQAEHDGAGEDLLDGVALPVEVIDPGS